MFISQSPVDADKYKLHELYADIDQHLRSSLAASSITHTRALPQLVAEQVSNFYKRRGWEVVFNISEDITSFTFTRPNIRF